MKVIGIDVSSAMAPFHFPESLPLESRKLFVIAGNVLDGDVVPGMQVHIPFNSAIVMAAPRHAVERVRHADLEEIALCIKYESDDGLELWTALNIEAGIVEVSERDA